MAKKFIFNLSPNFKIAINPFFNFRNGFWAFYFDLISYIGKVLWMVYFILLLASTLFVKETGNGIYFFTIAILIIQIGIHISKVFCSKNELLPSVANDLAFLVFTSIISASFFINTLLYTKSSNIWGGQTFHSISGISFILYWFAYYLISLNFAFKGGLKLLIKLIGYSFIIAFLFGLIFLQSLPIDLIVIFSIFNPGWLILSLTQKHNKIIFFINFLISLITLLLMQNSIVHIMIFTFYLIIFLILLIKKRNNIFQSIKNLDDRKIPVNEYLRNNYQIIIFLVALSFSLWGVIWISSNFYSFYFDKFMIGLRSLKFAYLNNYLIGNGILVNEGSLVFQFFSTYGLIPFISLFLLITYNIKSILTNIKSLSISKSGLNLFFMIQIILLSVYLLFENLAVDLIVLMIVLFITFISIQKQVYQLKKEIIFSNIVINLNNVKKDNHRYFFNFIRVIFLLLILILIVYLLSNLNYISIFIGN